MPCFLFLISLLILPIQVVLAEQLKVHVAAEAAILMNAETGAILYEKDAHSLYYPASITKIATALYGLKHKGDQLDDIITIEQDDVATISPEALKKANYQLPPHWLIPGATHMGLKRGEQLTLRDLFYGLMLVSAGDAANVIAHYCSGSIPDFMEGLNQYFKEIHCTKTVFMNTHGLFHPKHQTTAYEMALITREAMKNPIFREIVSTVRYTRPKTNKQESSTLLQGNKLLRKGEFYYPHAIGVKTGYLSQSEHTFVGAARQGDRTLIAVLLKAKERNENFQDAKTLFEEAFKQKKVERVLLKAGLQSYTKEIDGSKTPLQTYIKDDVAITYYPAEDPRCKCYLFWDELTLPIAADHRVGEMRIQNPKGENLFIVPLFAFAEIEEDGGMSHYINHLWAAHPFGMGLVICIIIVLLLIFFFRHLLYKGE
jgi:serine-type D-Ala-D-Ala carboxypeptidase (penicillin-binding protein 5/6)